MEVGLHRPAVLEGHLLAQRLGDPVEDPRCAWFSALLGWIMTLPMSPATQTL